MEREDRFHVAMRTIEGRPRIGEAQKLTLGDFLIPTLKGNHCSSFKRCLTN